MPHRHSIALTFALALVATPALAQLGPDPGPGDIDPGDVDPGDVDPGDVDPGDVDPGDVDPGDVDPGDDIDTARLLLSAHHGIPDADAFTDALTDPTTTLRALATDPDIFPLYRQRALSALAYWPDAWLSDELGRLATDPAAGDLMQHHAVLLLARVAPERARDVVDAWLHDDDVQRRLTAIECIDAFGDTARRDALTERLEIEPSPVVAERIEEALQVR